MKRAGPPRATRRADRTKQRSRLPRFDPVRLFAIVAIAVVGIGGVLVIWGFGVGSERRHETALGVHVDEPTRLDIELRNLSYDPQQALLSGRLTFTPIGELAHGKHARALTHDLIVTSTLLADEELLLRAGEPLIARNVDIATSGDPMAYPVDKYTAPLALEVRQADTDGRSSPLPVPVRLAMHTQAGALDVTPMLTEESPLAIRGILVVERSKIASALALVVMLVLWAIALSVFALTMTLLLRRRPVQLAAARLAAGTLFAVTAFREIAPGAINPPNGSTLDFGAYFWAMVMTASCTVVLALAHLATPAEG
jgi:hypothetical protein